VQVRGGAKALAATSRWPLGGKPKPGYRTVMDCNGDAAGRRMRRLGRRTSVTARSGQRYRLCSEPFQQPDLRMESPPQPDLVRARAIDAELSTTARARIDVQVQLAGGTWDSAEILAEGLDGRHGWRILLRWAGGYEAWFIHDPAKIRTLSEVPGSANGTLLPGPVLEPARDMIAVCKRALSTALSLNAADMGNVQLVGPATGALRIVAQHGFGRPFLDYFSVVKGTESACGQAFEAVQPVWVSEVSTSPVFAGSQAQRVVLGAGVRAVASVPVVDPAGDARAVISVHRQHQAAWTAEQRQQLADLALATGRKLV